MLRKTVLFGLLPAHSGDEALTRGDTQDMSHDPGAGYRCQKCGATSALLMPQPVTPETHVTLKCLHCAQIQRLPRHRLEGAGGPLDSTGSLE